MRTTRLLAVALTAGLLAVPATALGAATPLAADGTPDMALLVRSPQQIDYTGDGSQYLAGRGASSRHPGNLQWTTWTTSEAQATGANWIDNCTPDCAAGKFHQYPATLRLYRPAVVGGHRVFTRMTVTFTGPRPPEFQHGSWTATVHYVAQNHMYFWAT